MARPVHSLSKSVAALLGTLPMSLAISIELASLLPLTAATRMLVAIYAVFPLWLMSACAAFLAATARRSWWSIALVSMIAGFAVFLLERGVS